jgi:hypothetical protein
MLTAAAFEWVLGRAAWTPLPPMGTACAFAAAVVLSDGRMLVAGGVDVVHCPQKCVRKEISPPGYLDAKL